MRGSTFESLLSFHCGMAFCWFVLELRSFGGYYLG